MLTSTFLHKEPVIVMTPSSVSEEKVPEQNLLTVLVDPDGRVFLSLAGGSDETGTVYKSEELRAQLLKDVVAEYNKLHPSNKIEVTPKEVEEFSKTNMFGLPLQHLSQWLKISDPTKRDEALDPAKNPGAGIPISMNEDLTKPNEFQMWMRAAYNSTNPAMQQAIKDGKGVAIKADGKTSYDKIQVVMDNLQTMKMNKFSLMTALKTEED